MKKTTIAVLSALMLTGSIFAQDNTKADLQKTAAAPEVQQQFDQPDGAAIVLKPDGSFQIFARGTGVYDFDDVDDINDARKEGELKAKAALAKFMKEKLSSEESLSTASKKVKAITSDGQTQTVNVTQESVKANTQVIKSSADALLKGVITLAEQRIPRKGTSGEIQVTVGVSSKTLLAVGKLVRALDATPEQGQTNSNAANAGSYNNNSSNSNRAERRSAVTDF